MVARGCGFITSVCVDSDHAGDKITTQSRTWSIVYLNYAHIYWMSKK